MEEMRSVLLLAAALIATPALAQPYDAQDRALQAQIDLQADAARRAAAQAQAEADVTRQRLETEQRIQALQAQQAGQQLRALQYDAQPQPPPASSPRIAARPNALQPGKVTAKPGA